MRPEGDTGLPMPWVDRIVDVDGVPAHYLEAGRGETLLLVHGGLVWCSAELTYGAVIPLLAKAFRVVAVDVVGFGLTPGREPDDFSPQAQGRFLVRFLETIGGPVHIAGNSHGGWLVQYVAHEVPHLISRMVIINSLNGTAPIPDDYPLPRDVEAPPSYERIHRDLLAFYVRKDLVTEQRVQRTHELALRNYAFARARRSFLGETPAGWNRNLLYRGRHISAHAGELRCPVLLTWSRENTGASPADATVFLNRLRDGELHVFTNAGHHVMTEHPERWSAVVGDFLSSPR